jgi:hypothetical protein
MALVTRMNVKSGLISVLVNEDIKPWFELWGTLSNGITYIHTNIHTYTYQYRYRHTDTYVLECMQNIHGITYIQTNIHTYTHIYTDIDTLTHMSWMYAEHTWNIYAHAQITIDVLLTLDP